MDDYVMLCPVIDTFVNNWQSNNLIIDCGKELILFSTGYDS